MLVRDRRTSSANGAFGRHERQEFAEDGRRGAVAARAALLPDTLSFADNDGQRCINKFVVGVSRTRLGVEISHDER